MSSSNAGPGGGGGARPRQQQKKNNKKTSQKQQQDSSSKPNKGRDGRGKERGGKNRSGNSNGGGGGGSGGKSSNNNKNKNRRRDRGGSRRNNSGRVPQDGEGQASYYAPYLSTEDVEQGLAAGTLVKGKLRINTANRNQAFVTVGGLRKDVFIDGDKPRNRALPGDLVVLELSDRSQWVSSTIVDAADVYDQAPPSAEEERATKTLWQPLKFNPVHVDEAEPAGAAAAAAAAAAGGGGGSGVLDDSGAKPGEVLQATGRVVAIAEEGPRPDLCGELQLPRGVKEGQPLPTHFSFVMFTPRDKRYPYILISRRDLPEEYIADPTAQAGKQLFIARITEWKQASRFPSGLFKQSLGQAGEIMVETAALLQEHDVDHGDFPQEVLDCVAEYSDDWTPPPEELAKRTDLRSLRIFSIDPTTAKDLDDALSIEWDEDKQLYRVGVHIADVTYFVRPGTALDEEAKRRATTVYLVQTANPMLPPILCERLCSLNPKVDRLAFSCFWFMTKEGDLSADEPVWYGKSVIHTCCQLDYRTAQDMIDETIRIDDNTGECIGLDTWEEHRRPTGGHKMADVIDDVKLLNRIAQRRRALRMGAGAFRLTTKQLTFKLDSETRNPVSAGAYIIRAANQLVEEYMLLANNLVAKELIVYAGHFAFLRRHAPPDADKLREFVDWCTEMGFASEEHPLNVGSTRNSSQLQASIEALKEGLSADDAELVEFKAVNAMRPAEYFAIGASTDPASWRHYALAMDYYTHFTSPIRRYADIIVHRVLQAVLEKRGPAASDNMHMSQTGEAVVPPTPSESGLVQPRASVDGEQTHEGAGGGAEAERLSFDLTAMARQADVCNEKKRKARDAGVASGKLFLWVFLQQELEAGRPHVLEGIVTNDGTKYANVYLPTYGFTLPMYYDQLEMQLDAKVECVFKERTPAAEATASGGGGSAEARRKQFATTSEQQQQQEGEESEEQDVEKHIVTLSDGVKVEVSAMQHIQVELKANADRVGEYSILLSYN